MKWKRSFFLAVLVLCLPERRVLAAGAGEQALPPLIMATTLEEDYRALASLGLASTPLLTEENPQRSFRNILCSCVRIQARGHYGSGSIFKMLEDEIIIVTNRHVLEYWEEDSYITFYNGSRGSARFLGISQEADVGFLSVPVGGFSYEELLAFRNIRILEDGTGKKGKETASVPAEGDGFFMVDMATSPDHPTWKEGEVIAPLVYLEDFKGEMLLGKGEALPGMSGSGVFDGRGNYLGMVTGGTVYGEMAAVPVKVILEAYTKLLKDV